MKPANKPEVVVVNGQQRVKGHGSGCMCDNCMNLAWDDLAIEHTADIDTELEKEFEGVTDLMGRDREDCCLIPTGKGGGYCGAPIGEYEHTRHKIDLEKYEEDESPFEERDYGTDW